MGAHAEYDAVVFINCSVCTNDTNLVWLVYYGQNVPLHLLPGLYELDPSCESLSHICLETD